MALEVHDPNPLPAEPWQLYRLGDSPVVMVMLTLCGQRKHRYAAFMPSPELAPNRVLSTVCEAAERFIRRKTDTESAGSVGEE